MKTLEDDTPRNSDGTNILVCIPYAGHERDARAIIVEASFGKW